MSSAGHYGDFSNGSLWDQERSDQNQAGEKEAHEQPDGKWEKELGSWDPCKLEELEILDPCKVATFLYMLIENSDIKLKDFYSALEHTDGATYDRGIAATDCLTLNQVKSIIKCYFTVPGARIDRHGF